MEISVQYLEGGPSAARVSPREARERLSAAFEILPFAIVFLGWDLSPRVVEACAEECALHGADLYLWQPLLTGHGPFQPDPAWQVVSLVDQPIAAHGQKAEFTFFCPNQSGAMESVLCNLSESVAEGFFTGVFLDRIRFPSPAGNLVHNLSCFCEACHRVAIQSDLDLRLVREHLLRLLGTREGKLATVRCMLSTSYKPEPAGPLYSLQRLLEFRQRSISAFVKEVADAMVTKGLSVALDCYSPTLAPMVGQDLPALGGYCHLMKVMTYARAYGPASLPFEILGLADWLTASEGESDLAALTFLAEATGWSLPTNREEVRSGALPASVLTEELRRARIAHPHQLLAGIELVEIPGVASLTPEQIRSDSKAVLAGAPDGLVLSWDLWHMPADRLELINALYGRPTPRKAARR